jgi:acyl-CoA dehydrogenase
MDFTISESILSMIRVLRGFMQNEVYPLEREFLSASFREMLPLLAEKREKARAMGLWAPHIPTELGGQGLSLLEFAHVSEELGRSPLGHYLCNCQAPDVGNMEILIKLGLTQLVCKPPELATNFTNWHEFCPPFVKFVQFVAKKTSTA